MIQTTRLFSAAVSAQSPESRQQVVEHLAAECRVPSHAFRRFFPTKRSRQGSFKTDDVTIPIPASPKSLNQSINRPINEIHERVMQMTPIYVLFSPVWLIPNDSRFRPSALSRNDPPLLARNDLGILT